MRPAPDRHVVAWMDAQPANDLCVSAITAGEIRLGIALLPAGQRQARLARLADTMFQEDFSGRCLSYDVRAATEFADIVAAGTLLGRPISVEDAQTAATARAGKLTLAARNTKDFADIDDVAVVNPWRCEIDH
jgi:toxin FitB